MVVDIQWWDPFTAISSTSLSTVSGMANATAGIFLDPYKEYRRHQLSQNQDDSTSRSRSTTSNTSVVRTEFTLEVEDTDYVKKMALASASSLGKFLGRSSRGALVDLPLAAAEGMRAVPRLYGEDVKYHGTVKNWKSGAIVASSTFAHGLYEGVTNVSVHTYHGKKEQDTVGVAKGLTKGLVSFTMKTGAATVGLVAYPNQGIYRSLQTAVNRGPAKRIEQARWAEADYVMGTDEGLRVDAERVCKAFDISMAPRNKL